VEWIHMTRSPNLGLSNTRASGLSERIQRPLDWSRAHERSIGRSIKICVHPRSTHCPTHSKFH
jgi:hypothetical protein